MIYQGRTKVKIAEEAQFQLRSKICLKNCRRKFWKVDPLKRPKNEFQGEILRKYFVAKLVREAYESHVDCGLHEGSDQKH